MALVLVILSGWWRVTLVGLVAYLLLWPPVPGKRSGGAFANAGRREIETVLSRFPATRLNSQVCNLGPPWRLRWSLRVVSAFCPESGSHPAGMR